MRVSIFMYRWLLMAPLLLAQADVERVFHLSNAKTPQEVYEIATVVRMMTEIKELTADGAKGTITFQGSPSQGYLADWLMQQLDGAGSGTASFKANLEQTEEQSVQVFFLKNIKPGQDLQQVAILVRSLTDIRYLMMSAAQTAMVVRSSLSQVTLAQWLVSRLDEPQVRENAKYQIPGSPEDTVYLFYLPRATTAQQLQQAAVKVRTATGARRLFTYNSSAVLAIRGTAAQIAQARELIAQMPHPAR